MKNEQDPLEVRLRGANRFLENVRITGIEPMAAPLVAAVYAFAQLYVAYEISRRKADVADQLKEINERIDEIEEKIDEMSARIDFLIEEIQRLEYELKGHITKTSLLNANSSAKSRTGIVKDITKDPKTLSQQLPRAMRNLDELNVAIYQISSHTKGGISRLISIASIYATYVQLYMVVERERERQKLVPIWIWDTTIHAEVTSFAEEVFAAHKKNIIQFDKEERDDLIGPNVDDGSALYDFDGMRFLPEQDERQGLFRHDPHWQGYAKYQYLKAYIETGNPSLPIYKEWKSIIRYIDGSNNYHEFANPQLIEGAMNRLSYINQRSKFIEDYKEMTAQFDDFEREFRDFSRRPQDF